MIDVLGMVKDAMGNNQFVAGGLTLGIVGGAIAYLRNTPKALWNLLLKYTTITLDVHSSDVSFEWISQWLNAHPYSKKSRRLSATTIWKGDDDAHDSTNQEEVLFTPAPGNHVFFYKKRLVWLFRRRADLDKQQTNNNKKAPEYYEIRVLGRSQAVMRSLLDDAKKLSIQEAAKEARLYLALYGCWHRTGNVKDRPLESVILPQGTVESIVEDMDTFVKSKNWYRSLGIPYRRGYLLKGVPGGGKSSLVAALAGHMGMNVYSINLGSHTISDDRLHELIHYTKPGSVILFEDIDAVVRSREPVVKKKADEEDAPRTTLESVSLSGLLNALDGLAAKEGCLVFMTTNYPDRLDPALVRPGRIDMQVEFVHANEYQVRQLYSRFYECDPEGFVQALGERKVTMAQLQQHFLKYRNSAQQAVRQVEEL